MTRERGCAGAEVLVAARTATEERALQNTAFIVGGRVGGLPWGLRGECGGGAATKRGG